DLYLELESVGCELHSVEDRSAGTIQTAEVVRTLQAIQGSQGEVEKPITNSVDQRHVRGTVGAHTANDVILLGCRNYAADGLGGIRVVRVHDDDEIRVRRLNTRSDRCPLASVMLMAHQAAGVPTCNKRGLISGSVIHDDHFAVCAKNRDE